MKKTNYIFKSIIAMSVIVIFTSCSKEISPAQNKAQTGDVSAVIKTHWGTQMDSTTSTKTKP